MKYLSTLTFSVIIATHIGVRAQLMPPVGTGIFSSVDTTVKAFYDIATAEKLEDFDWVMQRLQLSGYQIKDYKKTDTAISRRVDYPREVRPPEIGLFDLGRLLTNDPKYPTRVYFEIQLHRLDLCIQTAPVMTRFGYSFQEEALPIIVPMPAQVGDAPISQEILNWTTVARVISFRRSQLRHVSSDTGDVVFRFNKKQCLLDFLVLAEPSSRSSSNTVNN